MKEQHRKESPVLSLLGMGGGGTGTALGGLTLPKTYVDDVFSTAVYTGNASSNTVPSGLDFTEGSWLSWIKLRDGSDSHFLSDSTQKTGTMYDSLASDRTYGKQTGESTGINSVGTSSYSISGGNNQVNGNTKKYVSWNFKAQKGFFDVVTYTGNDTAGRTVAHNLGSVPGMIIVKYTGGTSQWRVYHRSTGNTKILALDSADAAETYGHWNNTTPTSTHFTLGDSSTVNGSGRDYVAYVFAHDDAQFGTDEDESIIKCGSFSYTGGTPLNVNLGWEAQWLLVKKSNGSDSWFLVDNMRGMIDGDGAYVQANTANNEGPYGIAGATSTGFIFDPGTQIFSSGDFIYMAIRRPHKPPEVTTEVFAIDTGNSSSTIPAFDSGFPVDFAFRIFLGGGADHRGLARLTGTEQLFPNTTAVSSTDSNVVWDSNEGFGKSESSSFISYMFKRAPGFMDVVAWDGDSASVKNVSHNLEKVPEMVISKMRGPTSGSSSYGGDRWYVYHKNLGTDTGGGSTAINSILGLNQTMSQYSFSGGGIFGSAPTATNLPFDNPSYDSLAVNGSGKKYIAYLFATLPGISKVGSYTGTGSAINVPCGFTNGARFILIKRTNGTGDWYVWDTLRGIVSGNDPYLLLNSTAAQVTNTDYVDPLTSGFTVTASAPAALNVSGGTYIFLAIA